MKFIHRLKLIPAKLRWNFEVLVFAMKHIKAVKDYKFLLDLRKKSNDFMLQQERKEENSEAVKKIKIQIELLDKIINYVDR